MTQERDFSFFPCRALPLPKTYSTSTSFNFPSKSSMLSPPSSPLSGTFDCSSIERPNPTSPINLSYPSTSSIPSSPCEEKSQPLSNNFGSFLYTRTFQFPPLDEVNVNRAQEHRPKSISSLCNSIFLKMYNQDESKKNRNKRRQFIHQYPDLHEKVGKKRICKNEQNVFSVDK